MMLRTLAVLVLAIRLGAEEERPLPQQIKKFEADAPPRVQKVKGVATPLPTGEEYFLKFRVERKDLEGILRSWHRVSEQSWLHEYSHVVGGTRTGSITLEDGRKLRWMVKPGGLAKLDFPNGEAIFLARERFSARD